MTYEKKTELGLGLINNVKVQIKLFHFAWFCYNSLYFVINDGLSDLGTNWIWPWPLNYIDCHGQIIELAKIAFTLKVTDRFD